MVIERVINNGQTTVAVAYENGTGFLTVADASKLPSLSGGDQFHIVVFDPSSPGNAEIMLVTEVNGNVLTVVPGEEAIGGIQLSFDHGVGETVAAELSVDSITNLINQLSNTIAAGLITAAIGVTVEPYGNAAAALATAISLSLQRASNLSDLGSASTARTNLGLGTLATQDGTFSGDSSGTNTGDVTLAGFNYLEIVNQVITATYVNLTSHVADKLPVGHGGTGRDVLTTNNLLIGTGVGAVTLLPPGTAGLALVSGGAGVDPSYAAIDLGTAAVTGTLTAGKGGTGLSSYTLGDIIYASSGTDLAKLTGNTAANGKFLRSVGFAGVATAPSWQLLQESDIPDLSGTYELAGAAAAAQAASQPLDSDLTALASNTGNGLWARTGTGTGSVREVVAGSSNIAVSFGDGTVGNPSVDLATAINIATANLTSTSVQLRLQYDSSNYADMSVNSTGLIILSPTGTGLRLNKALAGQNLEIRTTNSDNTNSASHTTFGAVVGGISAGDPSFLLSISGTVDWTIGLDNNDSDRLKFGKSAAVGTNTVMQFGPNDRLGVLAGTSSDFATVGGGRFDNQANASTTSTNGTENDLHTNTTAANTLSVNGDKLRARYFLEIVGHATATRRIQAYFAGTAILDSGTLTFASNTMAVIEVEVMRETSSVVRVYAGFLPGGSTAPVRTYTRITGLTLSTTNILKITGIAAGTGAASGDITSRFSNVSWHPVA